MWWGEGCSCLPPFRYLFIFFFNGRTCFNTWTSRERDVQYIWDFSPPTSPMSLSFHLLFFFFLYKQMSQIIKPQTENRHCRRQRCHKWGCPTSVATLIYCVVNHPRHGSHEPAGVYFTSKTCKTAPPSGGQRKRPHGESHLKLNVDSPFVFRGFSQLLPFDSDTIVFVYLRTGSAQCLKQFLSWII